jgi:hypothetical protein
VLDAQIEIFEESGADSEVSMLTIRQEISSDMSPTPTSEDLISEVVEAYDWGAEEPLATLLKNHIEVQAADSVETLHPTFVSTTW